MNYFFQEVIMKEVYTKSFRAGWGAMDFNAHMANRAYLDMAADTRMLYFEETGFPMSEFQRMLIGPVILKDEVEYLREFKLLEAIDVTLMLAGMSDDGSRFILRNDFIKSERIRAATITSTGGWLNLRERRLTTPPERLLHVINDLAKTDNFLRLDSSIR
jgi:acyl-CoA thioester hydrolase